MKCIPFLLSKVSVQKPLSIFLGCKLEQAVEKIFRIEFWFQVDRCKNFKPLQPKYHSIDTDIRPFMFNVPVSLKVQFAKYLLRSFLSMKVFVDIVKVFQNKRSTTDIWKFENCNRWSFQNYFQCHHQTTLFHHLVAKELEYSRVLTTRSETIENTLRCLPRRV